MVNQQSLSWEKIGFIITNPAVKLTHHLHEKLFLVNINDVMNKGIMKMQVHVDYIPNYQTYYIRYFFRHTMVHSFTIAIKDFQSRLKRTFQVGSRGDLDSTNLECEDFLSQFFNRLGKYF